MRAPRWVVGFVTSQATVTSSYAIMVTRYRCLLRYIGTSASHGTFAWRGQQFGEPYCYRLWCLITLVLPYWLPVILLRYLYQVIEPLIRLMIITGAYDVDRRWLPRERFVTVSASEER